MQGLNSDHYTVHKSAIVSIPTMSVDFRLAYSYVVTLERVLHPTSEGTATASQIVSGTSKEKSSYIPKGEWYKLSLEQRKQIMSNRGTSTTATGTNGSGQANARKQKQKRNRESTANRKVAKMAKEMIRTVKETANSANGGWYKWRKNDGVAQTVRQGSDNPSNQFGRNAHAVVTLAERILKAVGKEKSGNGSN